MNGDQSNRIKQLLRLNNEEITVICEPLEKWLAEQDDRPDESEIVRFNGKVWVGPHSPPLLTIGEGM